MLGRSHVLLPLAGRDVTVDVVGAGLLGVLVSGGNLLLPGIGLFLFLLVKALLFLSPDFCLELLLLGLFLLLGPFLLLVVRHLL